MRKWVSALCGAVVFATLATSLTAGQQAAAPAGQASAPEIQFDSVPDFLHLPQGTNFGEVPGVAVDAR